MSHIARFKSTAIKNPIIEVLTQAAHIVAQQYEQGEVRDHYYTFSRSRQKPTTGLSIFTRDLERGVGLSVDQETKALVFVGDPYGAKSQWAVLVNQVQQTYFGLLATIAFQQLSLTVDLAEEEDGTLVVVGTEGIHG